MVRAVRERGGVARASTLQREGHSRHYLRLAVESGSLVRVARDWVAVPDADAELVAAARGGVVLTCVTAARRAGLWVLTEDRAHVAVSPHGHAARVRALTVHWAEPLVPRHPDSLVDPIENVLSLVAVCQPHEAALTVWESALGKRMVDRAILERMPLPPAARALREEAQSFADSGLETIFASRLGWLGVRILAQIWILGRRVDHLIGERLVVQIDGGHHVGPQREADIAHDALLRLHGYTVFRFGYQQLLSDWLFVQSMVMQAIAQGLHRRS
jgi:very-short-patch-repair endonuclease